MVGGGGGGERETEDKWERGGGWGGEEGGVFGCEAGKGGPDMVSEIDNGVVGVLWGVVSGFSGGGFSQLDGRNYRGAGGARLDVVDVILG